MHELPVMLLIGLLFPKKIPFQMLEVSNVIAIQIAI